VIAPAVGRAVANARLHGEAERRRGWLEGTVAVADSLARTVSVDEAEQAVAETVHRMSGAPVVALARSTGDGPTVTAGVGDQAAAEELLERLGDRMAEVVAAGTPLVIDRKRGAATLILPLQPDVAPSAVLIVDYQGERSRLRGIEDDVVMTMARHICLFLDRMHLTAERQRLLLATDRERIARDLHDLVIQRIFATGLTLQAVRQGLDPVRTERLGDAVHDLDVAMNDLRATIFELRRPPSTSMLAEVEELLDEYAEVLGFRPAFRHTGPVDSAMSGLVGDHALLALRETLSNAAKHARASTVTVQIAATPDEIALHVTDDGVGLGEGVGNGLANLRSRAVELGGTLTIEAGEPQGTRVAWVVPTVRARL
jgi:signal transduction histidine kinase